ncbi:vacuolar fusion protein CCZ1 homolog [Oppia nitens]|uniref:vacuolar fusion protein CCZ1 homolog n=1 Tax=Oppia nitens TaxID=1686743 RepID=UPI0023DB42BD|nr:vacuolar fusion protein CCZ1 homolog [Oppia nitens]
MKTMSQNRVKYSSNLLKYFVFNSDWGSDEGSEHLKIVYFYKANCVDVLTDEMISECGLAQAVITFVNNFTTDKDSCEALHGIKNRLIFYEMETNFWSVIVLSVPYSVLKSNEDSNQIIEYHNEEINDSFIKLILQNIYQYFRLINGPIDKLWQTCNENRDQFLSVCKVFYDNIIPNIRLSPISLIEVYSAIQYLPLDSLTFMSTQSFVNHLKCIDCQLIRHTMFLYNDQLVCSSLPLNDTKTLYNYLVSVIIPDAVCEEISGQQSAKTRWILKDLKVYLQDCDQQWYQMSLYRSINGSTFVLLLSQPNQLLLTKCEALMVSRIVSLTTKLAEIAIKINGTTNTSTDPVAKETFKFVYFNSSNNAFKANISALFDQRKITESEFVKLVVDIDSDLQTVIKSHNVCEIISKTTNDSWLIVHHSDDRTLFSMLNHKNANLIEASDTVNALTCKQFKNILFVD